MTIDDELIAKANLIAREGEDAKMVIAEAIAKLTWERQEAAAVEEGIDAYSQGRHRPAEQFFDEFMAELGLTPPG